METEKMAKAEDGETALLPEKTKRSRGEKTAIGFLVGFGVVLSLASMGWAAFSVMDMLGGTKADKWGLTIALTMDAMWAATMVAQYSGRRREVGFKKVRFEVVATLGWVQLLAVMGILAWHGKEMGNVMAVFGALLPLAAKTTWMFALDALRDPAAPTVEDLEEIAARRRSARVTAEMTRAKAEEDQAKLEAERREHAARLERQRMQAEEERQAEELRAENERLKLENAKRLELEQEKAENDVKLMREQMTARLRIETLRTRQQVDLEVADADYELSLRAPRGPLQGQVLRGGAPRALPSGDFPDVVREELGTQSREVVPGVRLSEKEQKQVELARRFYVVKHAQGGQLTKTAFCKANDEHLPRVSEATTRFTEEWFIEHGLADWLQVES